MFIKNPKLKRAGTAWVLMVILGLLAACGATTAPSTTAPTAGGSAGAAPTAAGNAAAPTAAAEPAAAADLEPVELILTYRQQPQPDLQAVQDAVNKLLKERINTTVKLNPIDPGAWEERVKLAVAGGEKMDLIFTANWTNNFYQNVAQENFLPLDDLLTKYAPKLLASMTPQVWNAARVNGKIYGVPNQILFAAPWGIFVRKDLVEKYKFDVSSVKEYADLEPFLKQIKENEPDVTPIYSDDRGGGTIFRTDNYAFEIVGSNSGIAIRQDDPELKAFNVYATPEFKQAVELAHKWYEAGYYTKDPLPQGDAVSAFQAGKYALGLHLVGEGSEPGLKARYGQDFVLIPITKDLYISTSRVTSNMLSVSATSENPDRAVMLLELLNSDKEVYRTLVNGVEGKHWAYVDKAKDVVGFPQGVTAQTAGYAPAQGYLWGNMLNDFYRDSSLVGLNEKQMEINRTATPSAGLGFAPDFSNNTTEVAQLTAVIGQYANALTQGRMDPATGLPEFLQKLDQAGINRLLAEVQKQLDAWKATKNS
ncbi:MAG TPA: ABC transporter substrate-binding protein [Roseiflexaceae bacterium]|nr:ABC transporter substrate-binding protein [Roseiflexaceae bacterium]